MNRTRFWRTRGETDHVMEYVACHCGIGKSQIQVDYHLFGQQLRILIFLRGFTHEKLALYFCKDHKTETELVLGDDTSDVRPN